uniref:Uncharacterized protein n=1 Tax=Sander lucioperca TaxID=283035 RepID=A0A8C9YTI8_SANLU
ASKGHRILVCPCSGELTLLERLIDVVIEQRVHFYAESNYAKSRDLATQKRAKTLLENWCGLFMTRALTADTVAPFFQFENVRYLDMYKDMLNSLGSELLSGTVTWHEHHRFVQDGGDQRHQVCMHQHEVERRGPLCHRQAQEASWKAPEGQKEALQAGRHQLL